MLETSAIGVESVAISKEIAINLDQEAEADHTLDPEEDPTRNPDHTLETKEEDSSSFPLNPSNSRRSYEKKRRYSSSRSSRSFSSKSKSRRSKSISR